MLTDVLVATSVRTAKVKDLLVHENVKRDNVWCAPFEVALFHTHQCESQVKAPHHGTIGSVQVMGSFMIGLSALNSAVVV